MIHPSRVPALADAAAAFFRSRGDVAAAYLFGSAARGREAEDLDLGVLLAGGVPYRDDLEAEAKLIAALQDRMSEVEIDVRILNRQPLPFQFNVVKTGRLLACPDPGARVRFETRVFQAFSDLEPYLERYDRCLHANLLRGYHGYRPAEHQRHP